MSGHGVEVEHIEIFMPHSIASSSTCIHTHSASGFSITGNLIRHDNENCSPGYPHGSALFFDVGTNSGLVSNNAFSTRCTAFVGYSASGVLLEDNSFQVRAVLLLPMLLV